MLRFTIRRFVRGLLTLWLVVTAIFFALRISGDPVVSDARSGGEPTGH